MELRQKRDAGEEERRRAEKAEAEAAEREKAARMRAAEAETEAQLAVRTARGH